MKTTIKIKQRDLADCGAACIASVAANYHLQIPVSRIRQYAGTDKNGTNVLGLIEAAEKLGFQAKAAKGPSESLSKIPLPAIAHVIIKNGLHHFVVILKVTGNRITIMDPGDGLVRKRTISEFGKEWTGVVILMIPGDDFLAGNKKISNAIRFWNLIQPHKKDMLLVLFGAMIYTLLGLCFSVYIQKLIDVVIPEGDFRLVNLLSAGMIVIVFLQFFIGCFKTILGLRTAQHIDAGLILGYYKHLLQLPQQFFDTMRVGEIVSRVNDAVKIRVFINDIVSQLMVNILIVGCSIGLMFLYYWKLALITLIIIPVYLLLYFLNDRINKKWQRTQMENAADLESQLVESLHAAGTIKRFGLEEQSNIKTENKFITLLQSIYAGSIRTLYIENTAELVTRLFTIVILCAGCYFTIGHKLTPGELLSFYALTGYFTAPVTALIGVGKHIREALIAADRLFEIIDLETENTGYCQTELNREQIGDICFHDVYFRYGTRENVFEGLRIMIKKGRATAIVGGNGSGKSTLLSLLQNLYPLQKGYITIGNRDIKHVRNSSLRRLISVVPQQIDLFSGTIIENIALGEYEPDLQKITDLSVLLGIDNFINKLPAGYHTTVTENGIDLSGGQRQRIAIARALYRDPEILILDEATSNLDPKSEQKVHCALEWFLGKNRTVILIAHKLSTIKKCDTIILLKEGKLAEQGTHEELIRLKGNYYAMW